MPRTASLSPPRQPRAAPRPPNILFIMADQLADPVVDLRPATDDRPFFNRFVRWSRLPDYQRVTGAAIRRCLALWPGFCLITVCCHNMFGDAMRDLLDPRLRAGGGGLDAGR